MEYKFESSNINNNSINNRKRPRFLLCRPDSSYSPLNDLVTFTKEDEIEDPNAPNYPNNEEASNSTEKAQLSFQRRGQTHVPKSNSSSLYCNQNSVITSLSKSPSSLQELKSILITKKKKRKEGQSQFQSIYDFNDEHEDPYVSNAKAGCIISTDTPKNRVKFMDPEEDKIETETNSKDLLPKKKKIISIKGEEVEGTVFFRHKENSSKKLQIIFNNIAIASANSNNNMVGIIDCNQYKNRPAAEELLHGNSETTKLKHSQSTLTAASFSVSKTTLIDEDPIYDSSGASIPDSYEATTKNDGSQSSTPPAQDSLQLNIPM